MSGQHFCFTSPDDPEPLECEQCAVFAERADYWRDAAEKRDAWLDVEMDRRRAAEAEAELLRADAERYRWLRDAPAWGDRVCYAFSERLDNPGEIDAAIDAARGGS